jgi:hypothetical protein
VSKRGLVKQSRSPPDTLQLQPCALDHKQARVAEHEFERRELPGSAAKSLRRTTEPELDSMRPFWIDPQAGQSIDGAPIFNLQPMLRPWLHLFIEASPPHPLDESQPRRAYRLVPPGEYLSESGGIHHLKQELTRSARRDPADMPAFNPAGLK